jgi:hypothetical protein
MPNRTTTPVSGIPLQKHPQFIELEDTLWQIHLAARALKGLGSLLTPQHIVADETLDMTKRSDAAAVFQFFGDTLLPQVESALNAREAVEITMRDNNLFFQPTQGA